MQQLLAFPSVFVLQQQQATGSPQQQQQVLTLAAEHSTMQQRSDAVAGVLESLREDQVGCLAINITSTAPWHPFTYKCDQ
jgi:hypothetical protein